MIINYFLMLSALLLFSGLTLDAGLLEWKGLQLQNAADSAAQEGMYELARKDTGWATAALNQAAANGFTNGSNGVTVTTANPPTNTTWSGNTAGVEATVTQSVTTLFMGLIGFGNTSLTRRAVAAELPTCVWIMDPTGGSSSDTLSLISATMQGSCGVYVNTASGNNVGVDSKSTLNVTRARVTGSAANSALAGTVFPTPQFGAATKNDPLGYVTAPVFSSCSITGVSVNGGSFTGGPGTYCGGMTVSNATVTLSPGLYIITGGLTLSNCTLYGTGITMYFTQGGGSSYGTVSISNTVLSGMTAPTSSSGGGIEGVFLFLDRSDVNHGSQTISITNSTISADGVWYLPNSGLSLQNSTLSASHYMGFVVDNIHQDLGTTTASTTYSTLAHGSPYHYEDGVLVQ